MRRPYQLWNAGVQTMFPVCACGPLCHSAEEVPTSR